MSDSVRPHRRQPTRLPHPWDSPGKNTGVGCHFLLQCMKGKSEREVAQSCPTLRDPMVCSLPGSSVHGIFQARVLEWDAFAFSICSVYYQSIKDHLPKFLLALLLFLCSCGFIIFFTVNPSGFQERVEIITGVYFYRILLVILEKAMAPHSSTLAWKIPWMEEPGRLQTMGSRRVGHN